MAGINYTDEREYLPKLKLSGRCEKCDQVFPDCKCNNSKDIPTIVKDFESYNVPTSVVNLIYEKAIDDAIERFMNHPLSEFTDLEIKKVLEKLKEK